MQLNRTKSVFVAAILFFGISGSAIAEMPKPTKSEYFHTLGGGFVNGPGIVKYAATFDLVKPVNGTDEWYAKYEFENPSDPASPIIVEASYPASQSRLVINSPVLPGLRNRTTYSIKLKAYSNIEKTQLVASHEAQVRIELPDGMMKQLGIKELH